MLSVLLLFTWKKNCDIPAVPKFDHITPTLNRLHWLPVCFRIKYKIFILSIKIIYDVGTILFLQLYQD